MTKITLSMDEHIIAKAKQIAKANRTSVSAMFSRYVQALVSQNASASPLGPLTQKASGLAQLPVGQDYQQVLTDALTYKYGLNS